MILFLETGVYTLCRDSAGSPGFYQLLASSRPSEA